MRSKNGGKPRSARPLPILNAYGFSILWLTGNEVSGK